MQDLLRAEYFLGPDEEDFYEAIEDSLAQLETGAYQVPRVYRFLLRAGSDSLSGGLVGARGFVRLRGCTERRELVLLIDKDKDEKDWADFISGGVSFANDKWRLSVGDFVAFFGRGLILSAPSLRAGFRWNLFIEPKGSLAQTAQENRNLRGVRLDYSFGSLGTAVFGSYALRDALLNSDGTVYKLSFSGVHDRSSIVNKVGQKLVGGFVNYHFKKIKIGGAGYWIKYDEQFSPPDSLWSFYGQTLGVLSCCFVLGNAFRYWEMEVARSSSGAMAAGVQAGLDTVGIRARVGGTVYQARFFSPAGRVYSLTGRHARFDLNGKIDYKLKLFQFGLEGNTQRDYLTDSIPARLDVTAAFEYNGIQIRCFLGRIYRMEQERYRRARVEINTKRSRTEIGLLIEDRYADFSDGQGVLIVLNTRVKVVGLDTHFAVSRFIILGSGVLMTVPEPGVMRLMSGYSSRKSGWRFVFAGYLRRDKVKRVGFKFGASKTDGWKFDLSGQLELEAKCD